MIRIIASLAVLLVMISAGAVYNLKEATERLEDRKQELSSMILEDKEAIKVLRAEMAYLSRPERLERLSERFLALKPAEGTQLASSLNDVAGREGDEVQTASLPIDSFRVLLPQSKPENVPDKYRSAPVMADSPVRRVTAEAKPPARTEPEPQKSFFERILVKLDKNQ